MRIEIDTSGMGQSHWYEYVIRFVFGGSITVLAGIVAKRWGPEIGGLFLAFPAIFPATATLIQKHEKQKKARFGQDATKRGREAAGIDAAGATIGSIGLMAFAIADLARVAEPSIKYRASSRNGCMALYFRARLGAMASPAKAQSSDTRPGIRSLQKCEQSED